MSEEQKPERRSESEPDPIADEPLKGLNLTLAYSLIAVAIFAAICIAMFIVLPFYHHHH
jgi:hypothetical protein